MPQFVDALEDYLVTLGHGPFAIGALPDRPTNIIAIYDVGGLPPTIDEVATKAPQEISIQIRARNQTQRAARDALLAIQDDLHNLTGVNIGDWTILVATATDRPAVLTREQKEGWSLVANYEITARQNP